MIKRGSVVQLQVMFGVPFGPEIDMWSLGCILAEVCIKGRIYKTCTGTYINRGTGTNTGTGTDTNTGTGTSTGTSQAQA